MLHDFLDNELFEHTTAIILASDSPTHLMFRERRKVDELFNNESCSVEEQMVNSAIHTYSLQPQVSPAKHGKCLVQTEKTFLCSN